ncbi:MAG TPA: fluoride efflux transporter CrcB [Candidatus Angelobacter sp.]|nr:fluoride efflux transporter CrcB [Candidatus Angelobacter sp.]
MAANILYLSFGAILGAILRFTVTHFSSEFSHHRGFPFGTLIVNVVGSLIVGFVLTWTADHTHDHWRLFAATGFCGAFTTFSAFAYESMAYLREGRVLTFTLNVALNNVLCMVAVVLGIYLHSAGRNGISH